MKKKLLCFLIILMLCGLGSVTGAEESGARTTTKAALRSLALPGWGQFYNGQKTKGKILLATEFVTVTGAVTSYLIFDKKYDKYKENELDTVSYYDQAHRYYQINRSFVWASVGIWVYGIIDAYWCADAKAKTVENVSDSKESRLQAMIVIDRVDNGNQASLIVKTSF